MTIMIKIKLNDHGNISDNGHEKIAIILRTMIRTLTMIMVTMTKQ